MGSTPTFRDTPHEAPSGHADLYIIQVMPFYMPEDQELGWECSEAFQQGLEAFFKDFLDRGCHGKIPIRIELHERRGAGSGHTKTFL